MKSSLSEQRRWRSFAGLFLGAAAAMFSVLFGFVVLLDPFGLRVGRGDAPRPLMDLNQRYMYPQLVRSGRFDAAILGTSTMRLIDPARLSSEAAGRFVNLAMNAATPWEQTQMAGLFARLTARPSAVIWGVDATWCEADATQDAKRLTPRPFPPWLYDAPRWTDWGNLLSLTTLEIGGRLLGYRLGLMRERIRGDGYEVFTPPEASYDLDRAREHLWGGVSAYPAASNEGPQPAAPVPGAAVRAAWRFPALAWLDGSLAALPATTVKLIVLPPVHISAQFRPGTLAGQRHAACIAALGEVAASRGAAIIDYGFASPLTSDDSNFWDRLHFRLPVARRVEADLGAVLAGRAPASADGAIRIAPSTR